MYLEESDCMVDNIYLEKHVQSILNIYYPYTKTSSHLIIMAITTCSTCLGYTTGSAFSYNPYVKMF